MLASDRETGESRKVSRAITGRGIGRRAAAWLLSLVLCLGSVGDLLAGSAALQGPLSFAGEICHAPGSAGRPDDQSPPRSAHDCCIACTPAPANAALAPAIAAINPVLSWTSITFPPGADAAAPNISARHKNARAPPLI